jgi:hypothetical protein
MRRSPASESTPVPASATTRRVCAMIAPGRVRS